MIDERTSNLNLPLPHRFNDLDDDVGRIREALQKLDEQVASNRNALTASFTGTVFTPEGFKTAETTK